MKWQPRQLEAARLLSDPTKKRILLRGGRRSGKTFTIAHFLRLRALNYPGSKQLIARKTLKNASQSVWLETMLPILKADQESRLCRIYRKPDYAEYTNGSLIILGGLAPSEIDDALGKEYSTIYTNECSEISYNVIPALISSLNERVLHKETGLPVVPKLIADCNPPTIVHWSYKLFLLGVKPDSGEPLIDRDIHGTLQMNPIHNLENLATGYLESLEAMSERDRQRFLLGEYGQLSGLIYDNFDPEKHIFDDIIIPPDWSKFRGIDFGFVHPFACLWGAYDKANETLYIYREWYKTGITINAHAKHIKEMSGKESYEATISDHDAGERAVLHEAGIQTTAAVKEVKANINVVYDLLSRDKIRIHRSCVGLINEMYSYQWKDSGQKEEPVKLNDDSINALQYMSRAIYKPKAISVGRLNFM